MLGFFFYCKSTFSFSQLKSTKYKFLLVGMKTDFSHREILRLQFLKCVPISSIVRQNIKFSSILFRVNINVVLIKSHLMCIYPNHNVNILIPVGLSIVFVDVSLLIFSLIIGSLKYCQKNTLNTHILTVCPCCLK